MPRNVRVSRIKCALLLTASFIAAGCVTIYNQATEKQETLLLDTQSEVSLGRDMDGQLMRKLKMSNDASLLERINRIGAQVAAASDRQDLCYYFRVVQDGELNAFAIPGGYVYVNAGLAHAANEDELACVLAHEIGHIAARHSVKKLQAAFGYQIIVGIALGLSGKQAAARTLDVVYDLISLGYSRKDELLADKLAVRYSRRAGFNPYGMVTFFEKLKNETERKGGSYTPVYLSSHPPIDERIRLVKNEISSGT